jgi:serine/threonine-protein kinase RsbW
MNAQLPPPTIDLTIPSELGYEKIAREAVAAFARRLGFDRERIEDLKTALCEACINAIEHGNAKTPGLRVEVHCTWEHEQLTIEVCDDGMKPYAGRIAPPQIEQKLLGTVPRRGMGLLLIAQLVDEAGFTDNPKGGNVFRLALYSRRAEISGAHD